MSISVNVVDYKADNTGEALCTENIQNAIDYVAENGGGEVYFPAGKYKTTTVYLKSNVTLNLDENATIFASPIQSDWETHSLPVIMADSQHNIEIKGAGVIDGSGPYYSNPDDNHYIKGNRPNNNLYIVNCKQVTVTGITHKDPCGWTQHYDNCEYVMIDNVKVRSLAYCDEREWNDGIDINGCRHVVIQNCDIICGDDAICLKNINKNNSKLPREPMYDVVVKNCVVASTCNATKIGTETVGDIYDVIFDGITVNRHPSDYWSNMTAVNVESNDHNNVYNITFKNYTVNDCQTPIFMVLQNRNTKVKGEIGKLYNITVQNLVCNYSTRASQINVGPGGSKARDITLENIIVHNYETYTGSALPTVPDGIIYPDCMNYGRMPAYGLFARDTDTLKFKGDIQFIDHSNTGRPMIFFQNVTNFNNNSTVSDENVKGYF